MNTAGTRFTLLASCMAMGLASAAALAQTAMAGAKPQGQEPRAMRGTAPVPPGVRVPSWSELSKGQREDLAAFADRWDGMPASRRVLILERYQRWSALPPERRAQLRAGERNFQRMSPEQRERMRRSFQAVRSLPPGEQERLRAIWKQMDPRQRRDWLDRGGPGLSPPPRAGD